ncbi:hypothetical protein Goari_020525 [Gossypium aridum]|uniref:DUF7745 domain-containing protein n=1 Tax=Gossypium aridum TaxID=34290 RepID=A0A7J8YP48_GOSAI|nr:hypothetical protein [Gossypium aridum]
MCITGMSEQWVAARIKQKGDSKCIPWKSFKDAILMHPDVRKRVDVFALSIYGLVVFPKALGHVDEAITNLFDRLDKRVTPILTILAETFRSLSACRKVGEGRFIGCAQLLLAWLHSLFWKVDKVSYQDIEWRAPWLLLDEILYRCGNFDWVPLLGIWGAVGYAPLLDRRINDNTPKISPKNSQTIEEHLQIIPSELEIIRQDFERKNANLERRIEQMEEEKMNLRLDIDVQKLENEKLRKGKNKVEEELGSLKTDYLKLRLSIRTAGLGKTSEQWQAEIREENDKADRWEQKF